jgi:hypothetical protein
MDCGARRVAPQSLADSRRSAPPSVCKLSAYRRPLLAPGRRWRCAGGRIALRRRKGGTRGIRTRLTSSDYAASFGMALSTNRKNRVLRAPATNDTGDSEFSGPPLPFRKDRVLRVPATTFIITHSPSRSKQRDGSQDFLGKAELATSLARLHSDLPSALAPQRRRITTKQSGIAQVRHRDGTWFFPCRSQDIANSMGWQRKESPKVSIDPTVRRMAHK